MSARGVRAVPFSLTFKLFAGTVPEFGDFLGRPAVSVGRGMLTSADVLCLHLTAKASATGYASTFRQRWRTRRSASCSRLTIIEKTLPALAGALTGGDSASIPPAPANIFSFLDRKKWTSTPDKYPSSSEASAPHESSEKKKFLGG